MSGNDTLAIEIHVDTVRAALRAHDEHAVLTEAVPELTLSPEERVSRRQEAHDAENDGHAYAEDCRKRHQTFLDMTARSLYEIAGCPNRFREARSFMAGLQFEMEAADEDGGRVLFVSDRLDSLERAHFQRDVEAMRAAILAAAEYAAYRAGWSSERRIHARGVL